MPLGFLGYLSCYNIFSEISALSQIREALGRVFSVSVDSQWPSAQNNPHANVAYIRMAYSDSLKYNSNNDYNNTLTLTGDMQTF